MVHIKLHTANSVA